MQESLKRVVTIIKGSVNGFSGHYDGHGQIASGKAFRQAQKVRRDVGLLTGKHGAGATKANGNFIGNQVHAILVTRFTQQREIDWVIHFHTSRTLYERLNNDSGNFMVMLLQQALRAVDAIARTVHRLAVSQRHLLEWTTAEAAQAGLGTGLRATLRRHRAEPLAALVLLLGLWWVQPRADALTLAVIALSRCP